MRIVIAAITASLLGACATTKSVTPRAYLDEQTTATVTVVADPMVFVVDSTTPITRGRDYLGMYAIDVNRMGKHEQYFAVQQWSPPASLAGDSTLKPVMELRLGGNTLTLQPAAQEAKKLGIAQPLAPSYSLETRWWYFPVDASVLRTVAGSAELSAALVVAGQSTSYTLMTDGRAQLTELTAVLP